MHYTLLYLPNLPQMRYSHEGGWDANKGLGIARDLLEPVHKEFPDISFGDLWTLAGVVAIEAAGGPEVAWKDGRVDKCPMSEKDKAAGHELVEDLPDGRLPDAKQGAQHLRDIFHRMGFNDRDIVALSGAHTLGRCHPERSGFEGPWTEEPLKFDNTYFKELLDEEWVPVHSKFPEWAVESVQLVNKSAANQKDALMMLPSDVALLHDPVFRPVVEEYAADQGVFFKDFAKAFAELIELGVHRE